jgi:hypothetical protein
MLNMSNGYKGNRRTRDRATILSGLFLPVVLLLCSGSRVSAQAVLRITPGATTSTVAGTGTVGYSGDSGQATSATFASPSAVAYDASGNLYIADRDNHVVRMVSPAGIVTTVAGTGQPGFGGDNGAATSAYLDSPSGVAVDASGNLYIADSHNQRVRIVSNGQITTVAGNGTAGFVGDGSSATAAELSLPNAVAVDTSGNLYIADTNNHRIRKVSSGTITTIAGSGEEFFSGDGGSATAAALDSPTGVAVDTAGNLYIADRLNHRVRMVSPGGTISTIAGSGSASFSGSFGGDGASATQAVLAKPSGVVTDAAGNIYIADSDNHRLRQVSNGVIATVAGTGDQGFGGDNGPAAQAVLNTPRSLAVDASGNLAIADRLNERVRGVVQPILSFSGSSVGVASTPQDVTFTNSGSGTLQIQSITFTAGFQAAAGGSCSSLPISLGAGQNCTQAIVFLPTVSGTTNGNMVVSATGNAPQIILLSGTANQSQFTPSIQWAPASTLAYGSSLAGLLSATASYSGHSVAGAFTYTAQPASGVAVPLTASTILSAGTYTLTASFTPSDTTSYTAASVKAALSVTKAGSVLSLVTSTTSATLNTNIVYTATVASATTGVPTGTVQFLDGTTVLGAAPMNAQGVAAYTTNTLSVGTHTINAVYAGDENFTSSTASLSQTITPSTAPDYSITANPSQLTLKAGQTGNVTFTFAPVGGFTGAVSFACSGLPAGVSCNFSPASLTADGSNKQQTSQLTITTSGPNAGTVSMLRLGDGSSHPMLAGSFLLPGAFFGGFLFWQRRKLHGKLGQLFLLAVLVTSMSGMIGCGFAEPHSAPGSSLVTVVATATATATGSGNGNTGSGSGAQHTATFTLVITQ